MPLNIATQPAEADLTWAQWLAQTGRELTALNEQVSRGLIYLDEAGNPYEPGQGWVDWLDQLVSDAGELVAQAMAYR